MREVKLVMAAMVCLMGAGGSMDVTGLGARVALGADAVPLTAEQRQLEADFKHAFLYIRDYQKAPDRIWLYPVQLGAMMRYGPDVLKWADACEKRCTATEAGNPEGYAAEVRLKGLLYQARAHTQTFLAMKGKIGEELPGKLAGLIKAADAETEKGAQSGLAVDFDKGRVSWKKANDLLVLALAVYQADDAALKKVYEDLKGLGARVEERQKMYWEKSKEKAKRPTEGYRASDLEKVRGAVLEAWKKNSPDDKGVTVIVPSNSNIRLTVASFDATEKTLDLEDVSQLPVRVVVEGQNKEVEWVYTVMVIKKGPTASPTYEVDVAVKDLLESPRDLVVVKK
jgi:hypothetical protein